MTRLDVCSLPEYDSTGGRVIITSPFGPRWGRIHYGTDQGTTDGIEAGTVPVYAGNAGVIEATKDDGPGYWRGKDFIATAGKNVWLKCDNGARRKYFHLHRFECVKDQRVEAGDVIGWVGQSGCEAPHLAPHLHEEEHQGNWSNPIDNTPDIRACIQAGRFVGTVIPPVTPPPVIVPPVTTTPVKPPLTQEEQDMIGRYWRNPTGGEITYVSLGPSFGPDKDTPDAFFGKVWRASFTDLGELELVKPADVVVTDATPDQWDRIAKLPVVYQA